MKSDKKFRAIFVTRPGAGHYNVVAPVARKMKARNHEVLLVMIPANPDMIPNEPNLNIVTVGISNEEKVLVDREIIERRDEFLASGYWEKSRIRDEPRYGPSRWAIEARYTAPWLRKVAQDFAPDLIVRDTGDLAGWAVARSLNIPYASIEVGQFCCFESDT